MNIKVSELTGAALDWAVAAALYEQYEENRVVKVCRVETTTPAWVEMENSPGSAPHFHRFSPSTNWAQGGLILERERISVEVLREGDGWCATIGCIPHDFLIVDQPYSSDAAYGEGPTPLIAAMRCYVVSILGINVGLPKELNEK